MRNSSDHGLNTVRRVMRLLSAAGVECWLFGGWAEESRGLRAAGEHSDIDLLYVADDFATVDKLFRANALEEIEGKHFPHKRAFRFESVMVELFLVRTDSTGRFTSFWGETRYDWPADAFMHPLDEDMLIVGAAALITYRRDHDALGSARPQRQPFLLGGLAPRRRSAIRADARMQAPVNAHLSARLWMTDTPLMRALLNERRKRRRRAGRRPHARSDVGRVRCRY